MVGVGCPEGVVDAPVVAVAAVCNSHIGLAGPVFVFVLGGIVWVDSLWADAQVGFFLGPCGSMVLEIWIWNVIEIEIVVGVGQNLHGRRGCGNRTENVWNLFRSVVSIVVYPAVGDSSVEDVVVGVLWVQEDGAFSLVAMVVVAFAILVVFEVLNVDA